MNTELGEYEVVTLTGPRAVEVRTETLPELGESMILVDTLYTGISAGTEMNVYRGDAAQWRSKQDPTTRLFEPTDDPEWSYPLAYGYAAVGRVAQVGDKVTSPEVGDLVFLYAAHASRCVVPADSVIPLPDLADPRVGVLNANLNTSYNGYLDAAPVVGDVVVVSGLGVIGLMLVQILRKAGIRTFGIDAQPKRRELAEAFGAEITFAPSAHVAEEVRALTDNRGADIVIEVSGASPALNEAIRITGYCGKVVAMSWYGGTFEGLSLSGEFHHNRPRVVASQVAALPPSFGPMWDLARRQEIVGQLLTELDLEPLITNEFPLSEAAAAYRQIDQGDPSLIQAILTYDNAL